MLGRRSNTALVAPPVSSSYCRSSPGLGIVRIFFSWTNAKTEECHLEYGLALPFLCGECCLLRLQCEGTPAALPVDHLVSSWGCCLGSLLNLWSRGSGVWTQECGY